MMHCRYLSFLMTIAVIACQRSPEECKAELTRRGLPLDQRTFLANVRTNDVSVVRLFLDAGMSPNAEKGWPPLMVAAAADRTDAVTLLLSRGALIDATNSMGESALCEAAARNMTNASLVLIRSKADVSRASRFGWQALHSAAKTGNTPILRALLTHADLNAVTVDGITPLMLASAHGHTEAVRLLLEHGAQPRQKAANGMTAFDFAARYGYERIEAMLRSDDRSNSYRSPAPASNGNFSAAVSNADMNGRTMRYAVIRASSGKDIEAVIDASVGGRIVSIRIGGTEIVHDPKPIVSSYMQITGMPIMFPAPNRVTGGAYRIGKAEHSMRIATERSPRILHGIAGDDAWEIRSLAADTRSASAVLAYTHREQSPRFIAYPYPSTLTVTYTITPDSLTIAYAVRNDGERPLAFGFGVHPYFRVLGGASNTIIQCTASQVLAHSNFVPTGVRLSVAGTADDIRTPTALSAMKNDNAMYPITPKSITRIRYPNGLTIAMRASDDFAYMVRYNPAGNDFVALEHQTCSPDAHNLNTKGLSDIARISSLTPKGTKKGYITYTFGEKQ